MSEKKSNKGKTNFGFKKVDYKQKKSLIEEVFSSVAPKYDIMNDLMSFGIHRLWKDEFCRQIPNLNAFVLDVASGTGDIAFRLIKEAKNRGRNLRIILSDINHEMLKNAKSKAIDSNLLGLNYICCDAEKLPFPDNSFDYYTIAFGIRNVPKIDIALKEAYRVLKPTGKFLCLEFSKVENEYLKQFYDFYSFNIIPKIGQLVTNNMKAYQYLAESIDLFPDQDSFRNMIKAAGFAKVKYQNLTFGIAAIHSAYKL